ncbi:metalloregulator ArsR/SmtB family transcription factor [Novosphingobium profundi]|uniref:ArsR/SmtB family transcription factor n=1 Tax=Novosphingobium profundi TaxID=1774954 RepID=UPI001BD913E5|nr:metalloregulator ArsR/SmtB family transcription factor [Novosphingobium profundi]MBT0667847.1 metalloregulator ArsR/SmtB family transcription factor [Novosphingobium profundi]
MQIDPLLRALSEPTRLRIMRLLAHMELSVGELAQVLGQSQPRVSRHVRILCDAGLSERRKEGSWVFLRSAVGESSEPAMGAAAARLLTIAERDDPEFAHRCKDDRRHLATIREAREANAQAYFARHAPEWDTLRQLHGADEPVEAALIKALGCAPASLGALLDVGTGTGRMAELLADSAEHVTALDRNPEMLQIARARLQSLPAGKVDLVRGDFTELPFEAGQFDTVLFHQVLHFAPSPGTVLTEAARVTRVGGRIAVVDLAAHEREELRERHAHARLGFSDEQIAKLMTDAGFAPESPIELPGDTLTVKIWTATRGAMAPAPAKATA